MPTVAGSRIKLSSARRCTSPPFITLTITSPYSRGLPRHRPLHGALTHPRVHSPRCHAHYSIVRVTMEFLVTLASPDSLWRRTNTICAYGMVKGLYALSGVTVSTRHYICSKSFTVHHESLPSFPANVPRLRRCSKYRTCFSRCVTSAVTSINCEVYGN